MYANTESVVSRFNVTYITITSGHVNFTKRAKVLTDVPLEQRSQPFFDSWPPSELDLSVCPPPLFIDALTYEIELLFSYC